MLSQTQLALAIRIARYIDAVTSPVSPASIDVNWAADLYVRYLSEEPLRSDREFARIAAEHLTFIGRTKKRKSEARPKSMLLWVWDNALCPTYTLSVYWKDGEVHRAFLNDPQEVDLLRTQSVRVILLHGSDCTAALDIDFSAANPDLWQQLDVPRPPGEHFNDRIGGKAYALAALGDLTSDPLTEGWVNRLRLEAESVIRWFRDPVNASRLQAEVNAVAQSSVGPYLQNAEGPLVGLCKYFEESVSSSRGPVLTFLRLKSALEDSPCLAEMASWIFPICWFSGKRTTHGHCVPSVEHWPTEDPLGVQTQYTVSSIELDLESLGKRAGEFWRRATLGLPFYYGRIVGGRNLPLDLAEFVASAPVYTGSQEEGEAFVGDLLAEARTLKQWTIPFGAYVQLEAGPLRALRLFEMGTDIIGLFVNEKGEYLYASADPNTGVAPLSWTLDRLGV